MSIKLTSEDCMNIGKYVSWLESLLEVESGCYSFIIVMEISEEYKKYQGSFRKILEGYL